MVQNLGQSGPRPICFLLLQPVAPKGPHGLVSNPAYPKATFLSSAYISQTLTLTELPTLPVFLQLALQQVSFLLGGDLSPGSSPAHLVAPDSTFYLCGFIYK